MIHSKNCLILILSCIILSSCTTSKLLTSSIKPQEITDLKLMEPNSYISIIKKGNRRELDDTISSKSEQLVFKVLGNFEGQLPLTGNITLSDTSVNNKLKKEYEELIFMADSKKDISNLRITPTLDNVLEANQTRFGLVIISTGFTRAKGNYGKQVLKGAALGIITLGTVYTTPIKAYSIIYAMIVDSKEDNVAFYRKSFLQEAEPLNETVLTKQYKKLFEGYFWTSK